MTRSYQIPHVTTRLRGLAGILSIIALVLIGSMIPAQAQAQGQAILNVTLHDSYGKPLSGVKCEVLSYDWGLSPGKPYAVIAQGETDRNGVIAFDSTIWPHSGYRFRFSPTDHTQPVSTFFMPQAQNQYRGYPAIVTGGVSETQYFAMGADGLAYNDLSNGQGSPTFQKDPVGGMNQPRVSPQDMSAQNFLAQARAATATAFAEGIPTLTPPAPAPPFRGIAAPLTITPQAQITPGPTVTPADLNQGAAQTDVITNQPTAHAVTPTTTGPAQTPQAAPANNSDDHAYPLLLAIFGVICLTTFWVYRHRIYGLLGLDVDLIPGLTTSRNRNRSQKKAEAKVKKPAKLKAKAEPPKVRAVANSAAKAELVDKTEERSS